EYCRVSLPRAWFGNISAAGTFAPHGTRGQTGEENRYRLLRLDGACKRSAQRAFFLNRKTIVLPTMSTPYNNEERRFALRMALRLPIVISGRAEDGSAWSEPTETDDISTSGALFHLNQKVNRGERLYLRAHRPDGAPIEVTAMVVRVAPAIYGTARVGVQISEPAENWLRLFVSWVADEQPAADPALDPGASSE